MIKEKAQELADLIKESEQFEALKSAESRLKLDPTAQDLVQNFQELQQKVMEAQYSGQQPDSADMEKLQNMQNEMKLNLTIKNMAEAQENFEGLMKEVNETVSQELSK
ncbi:YlbF family regulator [Proteinivorax tanatarense]|uniref:YlbF family regulator n=1 Tax=Proteinivorax tanatarense TaxID=1260629 RepID=A0AAU7VIR9_9FIRM